MAMKYRVVVVFMAMAVIEMMRPGNHVALEMDFCGAKMDLTAIYALSCRLAELRKRASCECKHEYHKQKLHFVRNAHKGRPFGSPLIHPRDDQKVRARADISNRARK